MPDLSKKRVRERLRVRREPHWHKLTEGGYLGFRRGPDTWVGRFRGRDKQQNYKALQVDAAATDPFLAAKKAAEAWLGQCAGSAVRRIKRGTVRAALEAYIADLRRHGREGAALEAEWRFKAVVWPEVGPKDDPPLAELYLETATQDDFLEWRDSLHEGRAPRTVNRYVRQVVAGLNRASRLGHVGNPAAWRMTRLADDKEDEGDTAVFLSPEQRAGICSAAKLNAAAFFRGLYEAGARPNELAVAKVANFDGESLKLSHRKGKPAKLRARWVMLSKDGAEFFAEHARSKLPGAFLFTEDGAQPWRRHTWAQEFRAAVDAWNKKAKGPLRVPDNATAYSLRHSRISELLQIHGVDPVTVAAQTGTSLAVIQSTYFKFIPSAMRAKLEGIEQSA